MAAPMPLITKSPDVMSGTPVFAGTRVPVQALFDYLRSGKSLATFREDFPTVTHEHAVAVIERAGDWMRTQAHESAA